jgi:hypothetical protein
LLEYRAIVRFEDRHDTWSFSPHVTKWNPDRQAALIYIEIYRGIPSYRSGKIEKREVGFPKDDELFPKEVKDGSKATENEDNPR